MDFRANDPGAVQFGNFINYYQFNSAEERLRLIPEEIISWINSDNDTYNSESNDENSPYLILDIGCNSGDFTQLLYKFLKERSKKPLIILGVDIDETLIKRATENNLIQDCISFKCADVMTNDIIILKDFLKSYKRLKFDIVFCLSITMWIHLNHSDSGLQKFLKDSFKISRLLVIEPQPWKCYQTAVRRMKKANDKFPFFHDLIWRTDVELEIQKYLENIIGCRKIYETSPTKWKRKLCFYQQI